MLTIRKILVPTDFSPNSERALELATEFAQRFDAELVLVHVLAPPVYPAMTFGAAAASLPNIHEEVRRNITMQLEGLRDRLVARGLRARALVRDGSPFTEIVVAAQDEACDLVVIATHGHTGIKHLLLGSTAERVVRKAPCPVLTVRSSEHAHTVESA
jgi:nucleotide-binding universal stress UspA family protein